MNEQQSISPGQAAALLAAMVPEMARVGLYPQWSDGTGAVVRRTRALPFDADGRIIELPLGQQRDVSAVLRRIGDVDLERPQVLDVATGEVSPVFGPPVPLWESPMAAAFADPYRAARLDVQRHELEDPAEPPLAVRDAGFARSVAGGFVQLPDWGDAPVPQRPCSGCGEDHAGDPTRCKHCTGCGTDHDPEECGYREMADVPVAGEAL